MQPDVLRETAVVGVEVAVAPLVFHPCRPLGVVPVIVHAYGDDIAAGLEVRGDVEAERHHAVLVLADEFAVNIEVNALARSLEFDEHLLAPGRLRQGEVLAVPHHRVGEVLDVDLECLIFVESMRKGDFFPVRVFERTALCRRDVPDLQEPSGVEVVLLASCRERRRQDQRCGQAQ